MFRIAVSLALVFAFSTTCSAARPSKKALTDALQLLQLYIYTATACETAAPQLESNLDQYATTILTAAGISADNVLPVIAMLTARMKKAPPSVASRELCVTPLKALLGNEQEYADRLRHE